MNKEQFEAIAAKYVVNPDAVLTNMESYLLDKFGSLHNAVMYAHELTQIEDDTAPFEETQELFFAVLETDVMFQDALLQLQDAETDHGN